MLYSVESGYISKLPHLREYVVWRSRLTDIDFASITDRLNEIIDQTGYGPENEIVTSSWIPGSDWSETPFQPIYNALGDVELAAMFFGLILMKVVMDRPHPEVFGVGRYEKDGAPIKGMTYYRLGNPPAPPKQ